MLICVWMVDIALFLLIPYVSLTAWQTRWNLVSLESFKGSPCMQAATCQLWFKSLASCSVFKRTVNSQQNVVKYKGSHVELIVSMTNKQNVWHGDPFLIKAELRLMVRHLKRYFHQSQCNSLSLFKSHHGWSGSLCKYSILFEKKTSNIMRLSIDGNYY